MPDNSNAFFRCSFSPDKKHVTLHLYPPAGMGKLLKDQDIFSELKKHGFYFSDSKALISTKTEEVNLLKKKIENLIIDQDISQAYKLSNFLIIKTAENNMKAYLDAFIPEDYPYVLKAVQIRDFISSRKIIPNLAENIYSRIADQLNSERGRQIRGILIAKGEGPAEGAPARLMLHKNFTIKMSYTEKTVKKSAGKKKNIFLQIISGQENKNNEEIIVHHEKRTDCLLTEKTLIARIQLPKQPSFGRDIFGQSIKPQNADVSAKVPELKCSEDIAVSKQKECIDYITANAGFGRVIDNRYIELIPQIDGNFSINISKDVQSAKLSMIAPNEAGKKIEMSDIENRIRDLKLGEYNRGLIAEKLEQINSRSQKEIYNIIISRGIQPVNGCDGFIEYLVKENAILGHSGNERVNHRTFYTREHVKKGQVLGIIHPPGPRGTDGQDVYGHKIISQPGKPAAVKTGQGAVINPEKTKIIADADGIVKFSQDGSVYVSDEFTVEGDISYKTGNIKFPGDVVITGSVLDAFHVSAGGDIIIKGNVDAAVISAGGSITVEGHFKGKDTGKISAENNIFVQIAENGSLSAKGNIFIGKYAYNSKLRALGKITAGRDSVPGRIIGSVIFSYYGIEAAFIGKESAVRGNKIYLGYHYDNLHKYHIAAHEAAQLKIEIARLEASGIPGREKLRTEYEKHLRYKEKLAACLFNPARAEIRAQQIFPKLTVIFQNEETDIDVVLKDALLVMENGALSINEKKKNT